LVEDLKKKGGGGAVVANKIRLKRMLVPLTTGES